MHDSTERFSSRVDNYVKFRPDYPLGVNEILKSACGLTSSAVIADVGSGTGIFSKSLLAQGFTVIGVEPNREMREAGEQMLEAVKKFIWAGRSNHPSRKQCRCDNFCSSRALVRSGKNPSRV
jgi:hypothetical protein